MGGNSLVEFKKLKYTETYMTHKTEKKRRMMNLKMSRKLRVEF